MSGLGAARAIRLRFDELQRKAVAFANGFEPCPILVLVAIGRWQCPYAAGVVGGVLGVGVHLGRGGQPEAGGLLFTKP